MITVLYFAGLKEVTNKGQEEFEWTNQTAQELVHWIQKKYNHFPSGPFLISVNEEYVPLDYKIQSGDQVAFIPPVSGG